MVFMVFMVSCGSSIYNDDKWEKKIIGNWSISPKSKINDRDYLGLRSYFPDSTFFFDHGDYHDQGIYWIEDSLLIRVIIKKDLDSKNDTSIFPILELNDSVLILETSSSGYQSKYYRW